MTGPTAAWLAHQTRDSHGTVRRHAALAAALGSTWTQTADALAAGAVNLAQGRAIVEALEALPRDLDESLRAKAEAYLVEQAAHLGPRELRALGGRVLEYLAPDVADEAEHQRLLPRWNDAHTPRLGCRSTRAGTGLPTFTRGSRPLSRNGCASTWTRSRRPGVPTPTPTGTGCRSRGVAARRSWPSWKTSPTPACPAMAARRRRSWSPSTSRRSSAVWVSPRPPPATGSPPSKRAGWPARLASSRRPRPKG